MQKHLLGKYLILILGFIGGLLCIFLGASAQSHGFLAIVGIIVGIIGILIMIMSEVCILILWFDHPIRIRDIMNKYCIFKCNDRMFRVKKRTWWGWKDIIQTVPLEKPHNEYCCCTRKIVPAYSSIEEAQAKFPQAKVSETIKHGVCEHQKEKEESVIDTLEDMLKLFDHKNPVFHLTKKAVKQFWQTANTLKKFQSILADKFNANELTTHRYSNAVDQVCTTVKENLKQVTTMIKNSMQNRDTVQAEKLLNENEIAIAEIERACMELTNITTHHVTNINTTVAELHKLIQCLKLYDINKEKKEN